LPVLHHCIAKTSGHCIAKTSGHHCHSDEQLTTTTPRPHRTSGSLPNHHTRRKNNIPPKTAKPNHKIKTEEGPNLQQQRLTGTERNRSRGS
jgi:hypothetical protein